MNLLLFEPAEIHTPLSRNDRRAQHLLTVLRRDVGDAFDAGLVNGPRGKGTIVAISPEALTLSFHWHGEAPAAEPVTLIVGLPRPQTARDILRDATTLGVAALHFVATKKGDVNYARSTLWSTGEYRRHLLLGAEQAFHTHVPAVAHGRSLADTIATLPAGGTRIALDNYESPAALGAFSAVVAPVTLAIGPERGWSAAERELLRRAAFHFAHLGERVLRTETAAIAALTLVRAKLGRI